MPIMSLSRCSSFHFIRCIRDGAVEKVHNMDIRGRPSFKFKKLEEIYHLVHAEHTPLPLADRETRSIHDDVVEIESDLTSKEDSVEELTLSQFKKKLKRKRKKVSEFVLLVPKEEEDDSDLSEPLFKFRVKTSKSSRSKKAPADGTSPTSSREAQLVTSELSKDIPKVSIKVEATEDEYFESRHDLKRGEFGSSTNEGENCDFNEVSEVEVFESNHEANKGESESESFTHASEKCVFNRSPEVEFFESIHDPKPGELELSTIERENCEFNEFSDVELFESNYDSKIGESESFTNEGERSDFNDVFFDNVDDMKCTEMDNEETIATVNQPSSVSSSLTSDTFFKEPTTSSSDCSLSQLNLQQTPEQVNNISSVQDSDLATDDGHDEVVSTDVKSPVFEDNCISQELLSTVPANTGSEVKLDHNDQPGVTSEASEIRQPERLPLTRKCISPNSQEKLCQAMKSADSSDDMEQLKCKEKLYFEDQSENKYNEFNVRQQARQLIQNKAVISSINVLKRPRSCKNGSPTEKGIALKGSLDGPRLCRSLPRLSTGCTSIEGCSENAIAFSQRQMHDIESLASKLMSELNSMKVIVEEKMLYEAYRSPSLKTEADEVKSAIKSATRTEETAKRWLSMMARDCNRFCKIMKLNEDHTPSASANRELGNTNQEKPVEREKKKISFADEVGGKLCDIKVYQIEVEQDPSLE